MARVGGRGAIAQGPAMFREAVWLTMLSAFSRPRTFGVASADDGSIGCRLRIEFMLRMYRTRKSEPSILNGTSRPTRAYPRG